MLSLLEDIIVFATLDEMMRALRSDIGDCHEAPPKSHAWELAIGLYKTSPHKNIRIVQNWIWLDVKVNQKEAEKLDTDGFMPAVLYAHWVIHDFSGGFKAGNCLCSSVLVTGSSIGRPIETRNSIYIPVGRGFRRTVRREVIRSIAYGQ